MRFFKSFFKSYLKVVYDECLVNNQDLQYFARNISIHFFFIFRTTSCLKLKLKIIFELTNQKKLKFVCSFYPENIVIQFSLCPYTKINIF